MGGGERWRRKKKERKKTDHCNLLKDLLRLIYFMIIFSISIYLVVNDNDKAFGLLFSSLVVYSFIHLFIYLFVCLFVCFLTKFCIIKFKFFHPENYLKNVKITVSCSNIHYRYTTCFPANLRTPQGWCFCKFFRWLINRC